MLTISSHLDVMNRLGRAMADPPRSRILLALLEGPAYPELRLRNGMEFIVNGTEEAIAKTIFLVQVHVDLFAEYGDGLVDCHLRVTPAFCPRTRPLPAVPSTCAARISSCAFCSSACTRAAGEMDHRSSTEVAMELLAKELGARRL